MKIYTTPHATVFKKARKLLHCSQPRLAKLLNTSKATVCRIEAGTATPTFEHYRLLTKFTGHTPETLATLAHSDTTSAGKRTIGLRLTPNNAALSELSTGSLRALTVLLKDKLRAQRIHLRKRSAVINGRWVEQAVNAAAREGRQADLTHLEYTLNHLSAHGSPEKVLAIIRARIEQVEADLAALPHVRERITAYTVLDRMELEELQQAIDANNARLKSVAALIEAREAEAIAAAAPVSDAAPAVQEVPAMDGLQEVQEQQAAAVASSPAQPPGWEPQQQPAPSVGQMIPPTPAASSNRQLPKPVPWPHMAQATTQPIWSPNELTTNPETYKIGVYPDKRDRPLPDVCPVQLMRITGQAESEKPDVTVP